MQRARRWFVGDAICGMRHHPCAFRAAPDLPMKLGRTFSQRKMRCVACATAITRVQNVYHGRHDCNPQSVAHAVTVVSRPCHGPLLGLTIETTRRLPVCKLFAVGPRFRGLDGQLCPLPVSGRAQLRAALNSLQQR